jgi:selenocysteine lyase/cysteine desulfurase
MQGVGLIPAEFAAWNVDFVATGPHKWLCAPRGAGIFYVAPHVRDQLRPLEPGWASVAHRGQWTNLELVLDITARRFEGGSPNEAGVIALGASVDVLLKAGIENVWKHVDALCDRLAQGLDTVDGARVLSDRSGDGRSGIVTFAIDGVSATTLAERLNAQAFVCAPRGGGVRVSPHAYNTDAEIDALLAATADEQNRQPERN